MKNSTMKKLLSLVMCIVLIAAMALIATGCGSKKDAETITLTDGATLGEGKTAFTFVVTALEKDAVTVTVKTDEETVGAALLALKVIAGEDSEYGLYVKTVNGVTYDYDTDGHYWAFYVDGEYAATGVDATAIVEGSVYAMTAE